MSPTQPVCQLFRISSHLNTKSFQAQTVDLFTGQKLLEMVVDKLGISARNYSRILKVARTIADLAGEKTFSKHSDSVSGIGSEGGVGANYQNYSSNSFQYMFF